MNMTNNVRRINKILNWFWLVLLLAPMVAWVGVSAVAIFQGMPESVTSLSDFITAFLGVLPNPAWLDSIWTKLFAVDGLLPFTQSSSVSLPIINYLLLWSVLRFFISIFIWLPCFMQKLIERWFE